VLRPVPVLVEAAANLVREVLCPHRRERAQALRRLRITNKAHNDDGRGLKDGDRLDSLLLVDLGSRAVDVSKHVGHARLVTHEGSQVGGLRAVILREGAKAAPANRAD
jgi:hypothetical protein